MSKTTDDYLNTVRAAAHANIAKWGNQPRETLIIAMIEELGEIAQAYLQHTHEQGPAWRIAQEADDLAPLALQYLSPDTDISNQTVVYTHRSDALIIRRLLGNICALDYMDAKHSAVHLLGYHLASILGHCLSLSLRHSSPCTIGKPHCTFVNPPWAKKDDRQ